MLLLSFSVFLIPNMSTGYRIENQHGCYFLTFTIVDWVDIFTRRVYKDIVIGSLNYCIASKGLLVFGYVIMSNHIHLIVQAGGDIPLSDIIRDFKKFTAKSILDYIEEDNPESRKEWLLHRFRYNASNHLRNSEYQVWTHDNHAIEIKSLAFF